METFSGNIQINRYEAEGLRDGVCKYLIGNICSIYNERPLFCRVDECFELFFKEYMSIDEYYKLNYKECKKLKELGE